MEKEQSITDDQDATELPDREAMSIVDPGGTIGPTGPATIAPFDPPPI